MSIATGQFTIIDYNDAVTLTGFINSNKVKTQIYNPDNNSYVPDWSASPYLVLTPSIFKAGSSTDIIASINNPVWKYQIGGTVTTISGSGGGNYSVSATSPFALTVNGNVMNGATGAIDFIFECGYTDASTGLLLTYKTSISFGRSTSGGGITSAIAWTPNGNIFKNNSGTSLTATCDLYRGTVKDTDSITYQWYIQNGGSDDSATVGTGWNRIDAAYVSGNAFMAGVSGYTTNTLTVTPGAVTNIEVFKCAIKDTDSTSGTYNQYFFDTVTFVDMTDPIQVIIASSGGDIFKNSIGSTTLTAKVFQNNAEVDAGGTQYTYTWTIKDKDGNAAAFVSTPAGASRTGKSITVNDTDITVKGTIEVNLT